MLALLPNAYEKFPEFDKSRAGKFTMGVVCQQAKKVFPLDKSTSDGKEVSPVFRHVLEKLIESPTSLLKVQLPNEVIAVHPYHALSKLVPLERFNAGNEVNAVQLIHA
jgi:hypothetical protein